MCIRDRIDKIAKKKNSSQRDVSGESVQQGMLKLLEGSDVEVPVGANSKNAMVPLTTVNTKNILFICGGAFPDLEDIIKERLNKQASVGFQADLKDKYDAEKNILEKVTVEDLRKFGMIPEFIGRLPIIFTLQGLDEEKLVRILKMCIRDRVGTEITLFLNEDSVAFSNEYRVREVLEKYCTFMPVEIYLSKENAEQEYETILEEELREDDVVVEHCLLYTSRCV